MLDWISPEVQKLQEDLQRKRESIGIKNASETKKGNVAEMPNPKPNEPRVACVGCQESFTELEYGSHLAECKKAMREIRINGWGEYAERAGILQEHMTAELTDFDARIRKLAAHPILNGVLIKGAVGAGKTRLMVAMCKHQYIETGTHFTYSMMRKLFRALRTTYDPASEVSEKEFMDYLFNTPLLAIDDLAHEGRMSESILGSLHEILSVRHGTYRPTIITTNLTLDQIGEHYDPSIQSRLGAWMQLTLVGKDRR